MGLGKTIQSIAFLAGLLHSNALNGAVLIVCPATVMQQWVEEFHEWGPRFRGFYLFICLFVCCLFIFVSVWLSIVALLHPSGTFHGPKSQLIRKMSKPPKEGWGSVLITTYDGVRSNSKDLLKQEWDYVLLDEGIAFFCFFFLLCVFYVFSSFVFKGHKIRNPDAAITVTIKNFPTSHRIILTG
jgi:DNA excision repair protein ERCC-6